MSLTKEGYCAESGKVLFSVAQLKDIRKDRGTGGWYRCEHCGGYHMTSIPFDKKKRLNKKRSKRLVITDFAFPRPKNKKKQNIAPQRIVMKKAPPVHHEKLKTAQERIAAWKKSINKLGAKLNRKGREHYGPMAEMLIAKLNEGEKSINIIPQPFVDNGKEIGKLRTAIRMETEQLTVWDTVLLELHNKLKKGPITDDLKKDIDAKLTKMEKSWNKWEHRFGSLRTEVQDRMASLTFDQGQD